jgi:hypothetical protein
MNKLTRMARLGTLLAIAPLAAGCSESVGSGPNATHVPAPNGQTVTPLAPSTSCTNEPTFPLLVDYSFNETLPTQPDGPFGTQGWNIKNPEPGQPGPGIGYAVHEADPTAPDGPDVADFVYPIGMASGWSPATLYRDHANKTEVYACIRWKPSSPWENEPSGVHKIAFWYTWNSGTGPRSNLTIQMYGPAPYQLHVVTELPLDNLRYQPNQPTASTVTLGAWHVVEWHMRYSPSLLEWWLDGALQGRYTTVNYPVDPGFGSFSFSPTWGGYSPGVTKIEQDKYWFNHVRLKGQ